MISTVASSVTIACLCIGALFGSFLRERLPDHHVRDDTKDVVKTAAGMIATLVALVVGLLVSSAKSTFDQASDSVVEVGSKVILLDRTLARYGTESAPIRAKVREVMQSSIDRLWPAVRGPKGGIAAIESGTGLDEVQDAIERLAPNDESRRGLKSQAVSICNDLAQARWLTIEKAQANLPLPLLGMLIFWLTVLFTSFGLLAPRNRTSATCLLVSAISMAGAIFLLMELNRPFEGTIEVSSGPLVKAVSLVGK